MQVDLSKHELELLESALDCWEKDPSSSALFSSILGLIATPTDKQEEREAKFNKKMEETEQITKHRKRQVIMLKSKLYQAMSRESEHNISQ